MELLCKPENEEAVGGKEEEAGENGEGDVEDENDSLLGKPNIDQGDDEFKELFSSERWSVFLSLLPAEGIGSASMELKKLPITPVFFRP